MVEKYIKDGKVAILHSKSFGCGWFPMHPEDDGLDRIWDKVLVDAFLNKNQEAFNDRCGQLNVTSWGITELDVDWVPVGREFFVFDYDGRETVHICGEPGAMIA